jgi:diguanylate cyclase
VSSNAPPPAQKATPLRVEQALQLLQQSGLPPPPGAPGSVAWLQGLIDALCDLSSRDALTGLANRRSFEAALGREIDRVARSGEPALLLLLDIDHFKRVNDTYGHASGDAVLRDVAGVLKAQTRADELAARYGGEEFAVVLPEADGDAARGCGERLRRAVEGHPFGFAGQPYAVTVSVGVGSAAAGEDPAPAGLIGRADQNLYEAKRAGRNRVAG